MQILFLFSARFLAPQSTPGIADFQISLDFTPYWMIAREIRTAVPARRWGETLSNPNSIELRFEVRTERKAPLAVLESRPPN
jgi:hypothetical protein